MPEQTSTQSWQDRWEALSLSWKACHVPLGTILISGLALASVLSAVFSIMAEGSVHAIP